MTVTIREPFWKHRAFGINARLFEENKRIDVECDYQDAKGRYVYPHIYSITEKDAKKKQVDTMMIKGTPLYIIPVERFEIRKERSDVRKSTLSNTLF
jgi:hypothetical protein